MRARCFSSTNVAGVSANVRYALASFCSANEASVPVATLCQWRNWLTTGDSMFQKFWNFAMFSISYFSATPASFFQRSTITYKGPTRP